MGLKAHLDDVFNEQEDDDGEVTRTFIQLYVECRIPPAPSDKGLGFTIDDVIFERGVILADVQERTDPPVYYGEAITPEVFLEEWPLSDGIQRRVRLMMEKLERMATPKENWLEHASSLYNDRYAGTGGIVKPRSIN